MSNDYTGLEVAVIGLSGRFPGADNIDELWSILKDGKESISFFTDEELLSNGVDKQLLARENYVKARGVVNKAEYFDNSFFGFSAREAELLDPQVRIFLECVYEALEDAGYNPYDYNKKIGLFAGANPNLYWSMATYLSSDEDIGDFANKDLLSTRISYKLNLKGPSHTVFTACSTSLVTIHQACRSLLGGECDMALAGGVSIEFPQVNGYLHQEGMILSVDGHNRSFDKNSSGTVFSNGAGVVALKLLEDAIADGDHIYAVIKGSAVNNDGNRKVSFPAPSLKGQAEVIKEALQVAQVDPETISYIEAHGSATSIGDPIEVEALQQALNLSGKNKCGIGSVKTNLGHLNIAAGVAGFIKTVLALHHKTIPASLHYTASNTKIDFDNSPLYVVDKLTPWASSTMPRRAGVSSFGVGGTNAHAILEEAPAVTNPQELDEPALILLSAKTEESLERYKGVLESYLKENTDNIHNVAHTLQVGKKAFSYRTSLVCNNTREAISYLSAGNLITEFVDNNIDSKVVFMFSGQGSQYVNMGKGLYNAYPVFRETMNNGFKRLQDHHGIDLKTMVFPENDERAGTQDAIHDTRFTQPLLFIFEFALSRLMMSLGVQPHAMIGHSLGEYVAATLAEVFSFEDALDLVVKRGKLMHKLTPGAMLAVAVNKDELIPVIADYSISLAAVNGSQSCVVSGDFDSMDRFKSKLDEKKYSYRELRTSHAFHSYMMDEILQDFMKDVSEVQIKAPQIPYISNLTGKWVTYEEISKPVYWASHLRNTVDFQGGMEEIAKIPNTISIEVGPGSTLTTFANQVLRGSKNSFARHLVRHPKDATPDHHFFMTQLADLWKKGLEVQWESLYQKNTRRRISLPTYVFDRKPFWFNQEVFDQKIAVLNDRTNRNGTHKGLYQGIWKYEPLNLPVFTPRDNNLCILFERSSIFNSAFKNELRANYKLPVLCIRRGNTFEQIEPEEYTIDTGNQDNLAKIKEAISRYEYDGMDLIFAGFWDAIDLKDTTLTRDLYMQAREDIQEEMRHLMDCLGAFSNKKAINLICITQESLDIQLGSQNNYIDTLISQAGRLLEYEHSNLSFKRIEINIPTQASHPKTVRHLLADIFDLAHSNVWLRGGKRYVYKISEMDSGPLAEDRLGRSIVVFGGKIEEEMQRFLEYVSEKSDVVDVIINEAEKDDHLSAVGNSALDEELSGEIAIAEHETISLQDSLLNIGESKYIEESNSQFEEVAQKLSAFLICSYLEECGVEFKKDNKYSDQALLDKLQVASNYQKFYYYLIYVLIEDGILQRNGNEYMVMQNVKSKYLIDELVHKIEVDYPRGLPLYYLVKHCVNNYKHVLSGKMNGVSVLFPEGSTHLLDDISKADSFSSTVQIHAENAKKLLLHYFNATKGKRKVFILEIGAGRGELTKRILPALKGANVTYYYTDIGRKFLNDAEAQFGKDYNFIEYKYFDINQRPDVQGFELYSFDIILGLDVIHITPSLENVIENLRPLVKPGGWMLLIENTSAIRLSNLIWGVTEGWWAFEDHNIRKLTPLISRDEWFSLIQTMDFDYVNVLPDNPAEREADHALIAMQAKPAESNADYYNYQRHKRNQKVQDTSGLSEIIGELAFKQQNIRLNQGTMLPDYLEQILNNKTEINFLVYVYKEYEPAVIKDLFLLKDFVTKKNITGNIFIYSSSLVNIQKGNEDLTGLLNYFNVVTPANWVNIKSAGVNQVEKPAGHENIRPISVSAYQNCLKSLLNVNVEGELFIGEREQQPLIASSTEMKVANHGLAGNNILVGNIEKELIEIWNQLFGITSVAVNDNYFDLGGDSLMMVSLISKIQGHFKVQIKVNEFYQNVTIKSLANLIQSKRRDYVIEIKPAEKKDYYITTSAQKTLFYMQLLHPKSTAYNITQVIELEDGIDEAKLAKCWNMLIRRHENLRTIFNVVEGTPCQKVLDSYELAPETIDSTESSLRQTVDNFIKPFNLTTSPAIRLAFIGTEISRYMMLDIHHIICDAVAVETLKNELEQLYYGFELKELTLQYKDFADWQNSEIYKGLIKEQEAYWMSKFEKPVVHAVVPPDFEKNSFELHEGNHILKQLDQDLTKKINNLTRTTNATLFSNLLATAYILLSKYAKCDDVVIGTGTKGRNFQGMENVVGNFVNTVAMRCYPEAQKTYMGFIDEVKTTVNETLENQDYQYEELVSKLPFNKGKKDKSLFKLAVTLVSNSLVNQGQDEERKLFRRYLDFFDKTSKFDIDINAVEKDGDISLLIEYSASLYKEETIHSFIKEYVNILQVVVDNPQIIIGDIPFEISGVTEDRSVSMMSN